MEAPDHHPCRRGQGRHDQAFEREQYFTGMDTTPHTDRKSPSAPTTSPDWWSPAYFQRTAAARAFVVTELIHLLTPGATHLTVTRARPSSPPRSGSLYLYDRKLTKRYKDDGHDWVRKRSPSSRRVREDGVKLQLGGKCRVAGFYARSATVSTMRRRSYYLLNTEDDSVKNQRPLGNLVLVHYLDAPCTCTAKERDKMQRKGGSVTTTPLVMSGSPAAMRGRSPPEAGGADAGERRTVRRRVSTRTWSDGRGSAGFTSSASSGAEGCAATATAEAERTQKITATTLPLHAVHHDEKNHHRDRHGVNVAAEDNNAFADHVGIRMEMVRYGNFGGKVADSSSFLAARQFLPGAGFPLPSSRKCPWEQMRQGACQQPHDMRRRHSSYGGSGLGDGDPTSEARSNCSALYGCSDRVLRPSLGEGRPRLGLRFADPGQIHTPGVCASPRNKFAAPLSYPFSRSSALSRGSLEVPMWPPRNLFREHIDERNITFPSTSGLAALHPEESQVLPPALLSSGSRHRIRSCRGMTPMGEDGDGCVAIRLLASVEAGHGDSANHARSPSWVATTAAATATARLAASQPSTLLGMHRPPPPRDIYMDLVLASGGEGTTQLSSLSIEDLVRVWDSFSESDKQTAIDDVLGKDSIAASALLNSDACGMGEGGNVRGI